MPQPEQFETLVLGGGNGGMYLAWHMARSGRRTAVVERHWIGGSCPNINCLPSKNEIWSAKVADLVHHGPSFGAMTNSVSIDMAKVRQRKRNMVEGEVAAVLQQYESSGAELIMGVGNFVAPKALEVCLNDGGTRVLVGDQVFVNVGTHASIPNVPGLEEAAPLTNIEALELDYVPHHLIVLGGGYVGLEMAQAFRRFGSRVTIIESGPQLAGREDPDVAEEVRRILSDEGIDILLAAVTRRVEGRSGADVSLLVRTSSGEQTIEGSDILIAAGRTPNTAGIGLEAAGVELDNHGYIRVNERLERQCLRGGIERGLEPHPRLLAKPVASNRDALRAFLTPETTRWQYTHGVTDQTTVSPDGMSLDAFYLARPGADEVQLDLFGDYKSNVALYPTFQNYFRTYKPPFLAVWGKNDPFFLPAGAEAFKRDIPGAVVHFLDTGHFALETHTEEIATATRDFLTA